jgi:hypothetical protein
MIVAICMAGPIAFEQRPAPRRRPGLANHNVGVGLQRAAERLRGHLAGKMRSLA